MLFLMIIFFYVSDCVASQDDKNSATLTLTTRTLRLRSALDTIISRTAYAHNQKVQQELLHSGDKDRLDLLDSSSLELSPKIEKKIIDCIERHFGMYEKYDEHTKYAVCEFVRSYGYHYRFEEKSIQSMINVLQKMTNVPDLNSFDLFACQHNPIVAAATVPPTQKIAREQSGETDRSTVGSYESIPSIISMHSARSRTRTDSDIEACAKRVSFSDDCY